MVKFKHRCRLCNLTMRLNLTVIKRHLNIKHGYSVDQYKGKTVKWRTDTCNGPFLHFILQLNTFGKIKNIKSL